MQSVQMEEKSLLRADESAAAASKGHTLGTMRTSDMRKRAFDALAKKKAETLGQWTPGQSESWKKSAR